MDIEPVSLEEVQAIEDDYFIEQYIHAKSKEQRDYWWDKVSVKRQNRIMTRLLNEVFKSKRKR